ncbi:hypothetical protein JKP88DRAFT_263698 [Tribonema minus]|uniref:Uncharacterized protein n=1 Tax=Tribonema minus TaxID=303371 RepID=A0A836CDB1_9STRA|nr:hypothetical protein JKP88DRAFT_263698 [Tribonema minus]
MASGHDPFLDNGARSQAERNYNRVRADIAKARAASSLDTKCGPHIQGLTEQDTHATSGLSYEDCLKRLTAAYDNVAARNLAHQKFNSLSRPSGTGPLDWARLVHDAARDAGCADNLQLVRVKYVRHLPPCSRKEVSGMKSTWDTEATSLADVILVAEPIWRATNKDARESDCSNQTSATGALSSTQQQISLSRGSKQGAAKRSPSGPPGQSNMSSSGGSAPCGRIAKKAKTATAGADLAKLTPQECASSPAGGAQAGGNGGTISGRSDGQGGDGASVTPERGGQSGLKPSSKHKFVCMGCREDLGNWFALMEHKRTCQPCIDYAQRHAGKRGAKPPSRN